MAKVEVVKGVLIGALTVGNPVDEKGKRWWVKCECGTEEQERRSDLAYRLVSRCMKCRVEKRKADGARQSTKPKAKSKNVKTGAKMLSKVDQQLVDALRYGLIGANDTLKTINAMIENPIVPGIVEHLTVERGRVEKRIELMQELEQSFDITPDPRKARARG